MINYVNEVMWNKISLAEAEIRIMDILEDEDYMKLLSKEEQDSYYTQEKSIEQMMHMEREDYMTQNGYRLRYKSINERIIHYWEKIDK